MPPVEDLENPNYKFATQVFSEDGKVLGTYSFSKENRVYVGYNDLSPNVINALIATEDVRFAEHSGIDAIALFRAIVKRGLLFQKNAGGGSTITQQLSKQLYSLSADNVMERLFQKPIEWVIAVKLERYYTKEEILTMYLNKFDFLNNAVGIKTAANTYFGCEPKDLKIEEAATLVGMCKNPALYNPVRFNERSRGRRNVVLDQMRKAGYITAEECDSLQALPLTLKYTRVDHKEGMATYFREYLRGVLNAKKPVKGDYRGWQMQKFYEDSLDWENNPLFGWCEKNIKKDGSKYNLYTDGLKIYTTIDMEKQKELQSAIDDTLKGFKDKSKDGTYKMQAAAVSIDNNSGYVVAIVGGRKQDSDNYTLNRAYQSYRQPGSSIKPLLVYTPQLERGYTPDTVVDDHKLKDGPSNANNTYAGKIPLRYAVAHSINTIAWQLYDELTPKTGLQYLKNMNFAQIKDGDYTLATSLGGFTKGVSPLEMASGYAAVENDGLYREPTCVKSIVDSDENVVYTSSLTEKTVYKQDAARMMTDIMTSVMDSGTGRSAKLADMPCAGKTGTTNDHKDGWFCGFTRYYTTAVWVGCDYPKAISNLSGSTYPAQIWKAYMSAAHEGLSSLDFLPYAQLSDDFKNQQKKEEEEHDKMREENQTDDQQTSESQQKDNTTDGSSENDNQPDNNDSNAGDQNNNSKPEHSGDNDSGESGGNTDKPENGENTNKPDNSETTDNSGDTGENGDAGGGNVQ